MSPLRPWMSVCSAIAPAVFAATLLLPACEAFARGGRGGYSYYQRFWQQAMQTAQKQSQAMQKQQKAEYDAFMKRFDTNKNGKIDGKEKAPAQKYLRELELGMNPDKGIKTLGSSTSNSRTSPTKASSAK